MAICLMDSDKAIGGLYLDADDFLHTGFLWLLQTPAMRKEKAAPSCFFVCLFFF